MSVHFSPASMPAKGIITNLTTCRSHGGEMNAHCYFNFHFSKYNETEYKFTGHCLFHSFFYIHCYFFPWDYLSFFHYFLRTTLYFVLYWFLHSPLIYYASKFPNIFLKFWCCLWYPWHAKSTYAMHTVTYIYSHTSIFFFIASKLPDFVKGLLKYSITIYCLFSSLPQLTKPNQILNMHVLPL